MTQIDVFTGCSLLDDSLVSRKLKENIVKKKVKLHTCNIYTPNILSKKPKIFVL